MASHPSSKSVYPLWLRVTHALNAVAAITLMLSGWRIYNASPLFAFRFPADWTWGGWLAGALHWHFAAMYLLIVNGVMYLIMGIATRRFQTRFWPIRFGHLWRDVVDSLRLRLRHDDAGSYNTVQKLFYSIAVLTLIVMVLSGLVLWKPVQFGLLRVLLGDYETARYIHFAGMSVLAAFLVIHVVMSVLVPRTLRGMLTGSAR